MYSSNVFLKLTLRKRAFAKNEITVRKEWKATKQHRQLAGYPHKNNCHSHTVTYVGRYKSSRGILVRKYICMHGRIYLLLAVISFVLFSFSFVLFLGWEGVVDLEQYFRCSGCGPLNPNSHTWRIRSKGEKQKFIHTNLCALSVCLARCRSRSISLSLSRCPFATDLLRCRHRELLFRDFALEKGRSVLFSYIE